MHLDINSNELALRPFRDAVGKCIVSRRHFLPHCSNAYTFGYIFNLVYLCAIKALEINVSYSFFF